jgi:hypothetical protein
MKYTDTDTDNDNDEDQTAALAVWTAVFSLTYGGLLAAIAVLGFHALVYWPSPDVPMHRKR